MSELNIKHILILGIVIFVLYHFMNRCSCNGFSVGGMKTNPECKDIAKGYQPLCGLLGVDMDKCSDYYTKSDGKGYFCVPDPSGNFFKCKQDDKICSNSTEIKLQDQYIKWVTDNRTFIGGECHKCGGCGEELDVFGRTVCKNDNTKWCWNWEAAKASYPKSCDLTPIEV